MPSCRSVLLLLLLLSIASTVRASELVAGPMIGHVTDTDARVWLQLDTVDNVRIQAFDTDSNQEVSSISIDVDGPSPFVCDAPINGLSPGRNYRLTISIGGKPLPLVPPPVIRTAPVPGQIDDICLAFGSDLDPAAGDKALFNSIVNLQPRAFFFLGNVGHLPGKLSDWPIQRRPAFRMVCDADTQIRSLPAIFPLLRTTPIYGIWDEHDYGTDNADGTFIFGPESRAAFQRFWPNPDYGTADNPGCFFSFTLGDMDLFMLDDRTYRDPASASAPRTLFGPGQLAWLKKGLTNSRASVKIIGCGCPLLARTPPDGWNQFPEERQDFINWLYANNITGVVSITGGRGDSQLSALRAQNKSQYPLFELTSAGLSANAAGTDGIDNGDRIGRTIAAPNFGTFDLTGPRGRRSLTLRLRDNTGKAALVQVIPVVDLRPTP